MKKTALVILSLCLLVSASQATQYALVGGIRGSLAGGLMAEQYVNNNVSIRGGLELDNGYNPIIVFVGGKFLLSYVSRRSPLSLGLAGVGYFGKTSEMGVCVSCIIDRLFDVRPMSLEFGADVAGPFRLMLQLGYKL